MAHHQAVYGIAKDRHHAERIVQALLDAGITNSNVSFLASDHHDHHGTHQEKNRNWRTEERTTDFPADRKFEETTSWDNPSSSIRSNDLEEHGGLGLEKHTKAPEGATTGATTGGIIGGALGLLAGIGALAIPGLGPFIAAGPLMSTLAGIGAGGTAGGILGALIGSGISEYEAKRYGDRVKEGGVLIAVHVNSDAEAKRVKEILLNHHAEDVTISSEARSSRD